MYLNDTMDNTNVKLSVLSEVSEKRALLGYAAKGLWHSECCFLLHISDILSSRQSGVCLYLSQFKAKAQPVRCSGRLGCRLPCLLALATSGASSEFRSAASYNPYASKVALGILGHCNAQASKVAHCNEIVLIQYFRGLCSCYHWCDCLIKRKVGGCFVKICYVLNNCLIILW